MAHRCLCGLRGRDDDVLPGEADFRLLVIRAIRIRPLKAFDQDVLSSRTNLGLRGRNLIGGSSGIRSPIQHIDKGGSRVPAHVLRHRKHESLIAQLGTTLGGVEHFGRGLGCARKE